MKQQFNFIEGLSYIPIARGSKSPTMKGWNLRENCITDKGQAYKLSSGNVGLAHAYSNPITCALDIDHLPSAVDWFAAKSIDLELELERSGAAIAESGRENSLKAFYRLPESAGVLPSKAVTTNNKVAFEFRCGTNEGKTVCDVIPPSIHPAGTNYRWIQGSLETLTEVPIELLALWRELIQKDIAPRVQPIQRAFSAGAREFNNNESPQSVAILREQLRYVPASCDREKWYRVVFAILATGWSCAEAIALEWSQRSPDQFILEDFYALTASFRQGRAGVNGSISRGTIWHYAKEGGWNA